MAVTGNTESLLRARTSRWFRSVRVLAILWLMEVCRSSLMENEARCLPVTRLVFFRDVQDVGRE